MISIGEVRVCTSVSFTSLVIYLKVTMYVTVVDQLNL